MRGAAGPVLGRSRPEVGHRWVVLTDKGRGRLRDVGRLRPAALLLDVAGRRPVLSQPLRSAELSMGSSGMFSFGNHP
jgi:hypothetical protein